MTTKFESHGIPVDDKERMSIKQNTQRTPAKIDAARAVIDAQPSKSSRQLTQQIGVSKSAAHRLMRQDLSLFPFKIQVGQPLTLASCEKRLDFGSIMCDLVDGGFDTEKIIFHNEAHF